MVASDAGPVTDVPCRTGPPRAMCRARTSSRAPHSEPGAHGSTPSHFTDEGAEVQGGAVIWATRLADGGAGGPTGLVDTFPGCQSLCEEWGWESSILKRCPTSSGVTLGQSGPPNLASVFIRQGRGSTECPRALTFCGAVDRPEVNAVAYLRAFAPAGPGELSRRYPHGSLLRRLL